MVNVREDLTGQIFNKLKVLYQTDDYISPNGRHSAQWLCECSCDEHNQVVVRGEHLKSGQTQSCGCLRITSNKKYNRYKLNLEDEYGLYGIGYCTNTGREFYFDMDDYGKIKDICWCESVTHGLHCIVGNITNQKKTIAMHIFLGYRGYDHADRNELNNRRYNLRVATSIENGQNKSVSTRNTSGVVGVSWCKRDQKWESYIKYDGKLIRLGKFENKEDAIKIRLDAETKYFGEFAPQKHLFAKYNINYNTKLMR